MKTSLNIIQFGSNLIIFEICIDLFEVLSRDDLIENHEQLTITVLCGESCGFKFNNISN